MGQYWQQTIKQWPWPFCGASLALGSALELLLSPITELGVAGCRINSIFIAHQNPNEKWFITVQNKRRHFKMKIFFLLICGQLMRHPLIVLFHLFNFLQMLNNCRMVDVDFFSNLCSCKRISFDDYSQLVIVNFKWLVTVLFIFKALVSFGNFLHHCTIHSLAVSGPTALLIMRVVSAALELILNLNQKITQICFLSNIISVD